MTTKFHLESWRKLYRTLPPSWLMLPLFARGLGDEMLKYVDDTGLFALPPGEPVDEAVARIMCAHKSERKQIKPLLEALVLDGYLVRTAKGLVIRNFVVAQGRTPSANRMAAKRERDRNGSKAGDGNGDGHNRRHSDAPCDGTVHERSDGHDNDTTRPDLSIETTTPPEPPRPKTPPRVVGGVAIREAIREELEASPKLREFAHTEAIESLAADALMSGKSLEAVTESIRTIGKKATTGAWAKNRVEGALVKAVEWAKEPNQAPRESDSHEPPPNHAANMQPPQKGAVGGI